MSSLVGLLRSGRNVVLGSLVDFGMAGRSEGGTLAYAAPERLGGTANVALILANGAVWIDGTETSTIPGPELRRQVGYVFQQVGLFPHMTVAENVGVTPALLGWSSDRTRAKVDELLAQIQTPGPVDQTPDPVE